MTINKVNSKKIVYKLQKTQNTGNIKIWTKTVF